MTGGSTIEAPGEFDALVKLRPREPYFVLIGRDRFASRLVLDWVDLNRRRAMEESRAGKMSEEALHHELRQSTEAEQIAWRMHAYKKPGWGHPEPEAEKAPLARVDGTTGLDPRPEELIVRERIVAQQARAVSALHNAIAETNDLNELIGSKADVELILEWLREAVDVLTPKRPILDATPCA